MERLSENFRRPVYRRVGKIPFIIVMKLHTLISLVLTRN